MGTFNQWTKTKTILVSLIILSLDNLVFIICHTITNCGIITTHYVIDGIHVYVEVLLCWLLFQVSKYLIQKIDKVETTSIILYKWRIILKICYDLIVTCISHDKQLNWYSTLAHGKQKDWLSFKTNTKK